VAKKTLFFSIHPGWAGLGCKKNTPSADLNPFTTTTTKTRPHG